MPRLILCTILGLAICSYAIAQKPAPKKFGQRISDTQLDAPKRGVLDALGKGAAENPRVPYTAMVMTETPAGANVVAMNEGEVVNVVDARADESLVVDEVGYRRWVKTTTIQSLPAAKAVLKRELKKSPTDFDVLFRLASIGFNTQEYREALSYSDQLVKHHPAKSNVYVARSQLLTSMERYRDAINAATQGMQIQKSAVLYVNRGLAYSRSGDPDKALLDYEKAIELDQKSVMALNNRASILSDRGRIDEAIRDYTVALRIRDVDFLYRGRGIAYEQKKDFQAAIKDLSKAIELNPANARNYLSRGRMKYAKNDLEGAQADFNEAVRLAPKDAYALNDMGAVLAETGRAEEALKLYYQAIELNPNYALAYSNISSSLTALGRFDDALEAAIKATELEPTLAIAHFNHAKALRKLEMDRDAVGAFTQAIGNAPDKLNYRNDRGVLYLDLGELDLAKSDFQHCINEQPAESLYWTNRGRVWQRMGQNGKALADYGKAIELNPKDDFAFSRRGRLMLNLKQYDKAVVDLQRVTQIDPDWVGAWFDLGRACTGAGLMEEAANVYSEALKRAPNHFSSRCNRSYVYLQLKKYEEAKADGLKAIQLDPLDMDATYNLAIAYFRLNEDTQAVQQFSIIIGTDGGNFDVFSFRGDSYLNLGRFEEAIKDYNECLNLKPFSMGVVHARGYAKSKLGRQDEALKDFNTVLAAEPNRVRTRFLRGNLLRRKSEFGKAIEDYRAIVKAEPEHLGANLNLAAILSGAHDQSVLNGDEAIVFAKKSVELTGEKSPFEISILAVAYARAGDFDQAIETAVKATIVGDDNNQRPPSWLPAALEAFRDDKPYEIDLGV